MKPPTRSRLKVITLLLAVLALAVVSQEVRAATFNIANGDVPGLIAAINAVNVGPGPDTINLAPGGTYILTAVAEDDGYSGGAGLPYIRRPLTINGNGATIQRSSAAGTPDFRIVYVWLSDLTLNGVTIKGGRGGNVNRGGGGIGMVGSKLNVADSTITDNVGFGLGGGGIGSIASTFRIENSTISHNTSFSGYGGGGIINVAAGATSTITSSTIFENQNDSGRGDAIADAFSGPGTMVVKNSVLASPTRGVSDDCYAAPGVVVSQGHNIAGDGTCSLTGPGDMNSTNPLLGPLANNGGNTSTHALLAGSPAIDAIPLTDCTDTAGAPIITDQRGVFRPQGARCDTGSYEIVPSGGPDRYNDRQSFLTALCPTATTKTIDFSTKDDGTFITDPNADTYFETLTLRGVTFHQVQSYYNSLIYYFPTAVIKADLPPNTFSFGVDLSPGYGAAGTFTITLSTGQTYYINTGGTSAFFGVISSTPIEWASFSFNNNYLIIDNFVVGTACDSTPPVITPTVTGTLGNDGWYTSDVEVSWSVTDPECGISTSTGCDTTNVTADTNGVTFTCTATSGGGSSNQSVTIKRDASAPSVSCGSSDGAWHSSDVSIACTSSDNFSQLANAGDASFSLATSVSAGMETANASTGNRSVCDNAGNCTNAGPITGNKIDKKSPVITITAPSAGNYLLNQAVSVNFNCTDGGSGVASCVGTSANGGALDTSAAGARTFTVSATDNAGNSASPSVVNYTVDFGFQVLFDQSKAHKSGSTIPIKIRLVDANGANVSSAATLLHAVSVVQTASQASPFIEDAGNSNPDFDFRYDASLGGYIFNLKTTGYGTGSYLLKFVAGGSSTVYAVGFQVRQ